MHRLFLSVHYAEGQNHSAAYYYDGLGYLHSIYRTGGMETFRTAPSVPGWCIPGGEGSARGRGCDQGNVAIEESPPGDWRTVAARRPRQGGRPS